MPPPDLVEVARFRRKVLANERALVMAAMGIPYWLLRDDDRYLLCVEEKHSAAARTELEKFEGERTLRPRRAGDYDLQTKIPLGSLLGFVWVMIGFFMIQQTMGDPWEDKGVASSEAILHGEIWRTVTALTLHADAAHIGANIATGALFGAFLIPLFGTGAAWFAMLCTGALGNWLNAYGHRGETHLSIGASTAVFGGLGLLVGCQLVTQLWARRRFRLWEVIVPVGAGFALLAFLGVGDEHVDYMAHFCGLTAGVVLGVIAGAAQVGARLPARAQAYFGAATLAILIGAWILASRG